MMPALTQDVTKNYSLFYTYNPPTIKSKHNLLTQLTFLNLIRITGGLYSEIKQADIVLLFFY